MLGHRETSWCASLKKYEGVRKHYKGTVSTLLSEKQRITRARKVFPNIFSLIEVDSDGKKVGNTCSSPQIRKRNCWQFQNTVPDHSLINTRFTGEVHLRPNFFSLTELGSRGKKVGRENCKLEKRVSGATQGFTKNLHDIHLCAWTVPGYCPSRVRINIPLSQDASAKRWPSNFFPSALDFWTFEATVSARARERKPLITLIS